MQSNRSREGETNFPVPLREIPGTKYLLFRLGPLQPGGPRSPEDRAFRKTAGTCPGMHLPSPREGGSRERRKGSLHKGSRCSPKSQNVLDFDT